MSWSQTYYAQFPDEATARAFAASLGVDFPADGSIPTGNTNYALVAPIVEWSRQPAFSDSGAMVDPGELMPGYWAMARFNLATAAGQTAHAAFTATQYNVERTNPSNVFL